MTDSEDTPDQMIILPTAGYGCTLYRSDLVRAVRQVMLDSHSSYYMRWEIRADSSKDMSQEVAEMFVDELILPALERLNYGWWEGKD